MFACLFLSPAVVVSSESEPDALEAAARAFSPRVEVHASHLVTLDIDGLRHLLGSPADIGRELLRDVQGRGCQAHVAVAAARTAAMLLAVARPGLTIVPPGDERRELAGLPLAVLAALHAIVPDAPGLPARRVPRVKDASCPPILDLFRRWGLRTLGELATLPPAALSARIGQDGLRWQRLARGEDLEPLVARAPEPPIEERLELDWPVEGLEPLSFLLPRLLDPICERLERLDQAAVTLEATFRLATREEVARRLQLPAPMRDAKVLRTLLLLHLESYPLGGGIDRMVLRVEPAPARIVQFSLLSRAMPFPEQMATLLARLGALMGERRVGAPALVDSHRPGAFAMRSFSVSEPTAGRSGARRPASLPAPALDGPDTPPGPAVALRRFRLPVPARVLVQDGRPVRVTTERRGLEGGRVEAAAGPWRTSGEWWRVGDEAGSGPKGWNRDEWDVALSDGAVYRVYRDRADERWFVAGILD
jgi:protein ImuB